jgi:hypothetical protein
MFGWFRKLTTERLEARADALTTSAIDLRADAHEHIGF